MASTPVTLNLDAVFEQIDAACDLAAQLELPDVVEVLNNAMIILRAAVVLAEGDMDRATLSSLIAPAIAPHCRVLLAALGGANASEPHRTA